MVLQVEQLSKQYRLGTISTGSLRQDLHYWWQKNIRKKQEEVLSGKRSANTILALKDINFTVNQGEVLGIIGDNGSGKSTLLKIISRIVEPTRGYVRGRGRISSILEVGTGFNNELTGRENIFNSGYVLGMSKTEILRKFDEIVAFSGIENFIDTPVKRYSSGMYVRLAFSVVAHLEPDILIIDEVLAVGDAGFQKKCLGKMKEVAAKSDRTILFVSHSMPAIANLCTEAIWLDKGIIQKKGTPAETIAAYIGTAHADTNSRQWAEPENAPGNNSIKMKRISVKPVPDEPGSYISVKTPVKLEAEFWCFEENCSLNINVRLMTANGECVFDLGSPAIAAEKAILALNSIIPANLLNNTTYFIALTIVKDNAVHLYSFNNCISFQVEDDRKGLHYYGVWPGIIRPALETALYKKENFTS